MTDETTTTQPQEQNLTDSPHYLAQALMANGIKNMYGVVGIPVTDFARIAQGMGMRFIGMRHEEDAVNAAAAEGFLTGKPAVALTVSAPGFLNGLAAMLEATTNGFPVIMIGGSSTRHVVDMHKGEYEGLDQMNYAKAFCKESFRIDKIEDIPLAVARAMHIACSGRPGAVYIDFPDDAVAQTMDKDEAAAKLWTANQPNPAMPPAQASIDEALKLLSEAKNPLMVVGKGAALAQAEDELKEFVSKTDIPFQPMSMAKGLIPDDNPHCTASARGLALRTADVVLLVGARLNWMLNFGEGKEWNPNVKFIQIEIDPNEIENARPIACPVVGDIKSAMTMLNAGLEKTPFKASAEWLSAIQADSKQNDEKFAARINSGKVPMGHYDALGAIKKVYDQHKDAIITNEGANTLDDCRNIIDIYQPRHRLDCGTWGVMGCAVGYSIGAAVSTGKQVLYIGGDSGFGFDGMEVEVACRYNLPITFVVLNNGGIYRGDFENLGNDGDPSPLTLTYDAHYEKMIEAFGGKGYYATTPDEVEQMVGEAVASGKPSFVHVQLADYAGKESGHISNLNPKPVVGPLATSEVTADPYIEGAHM
ncbi:Oxalyl-CoA decarboxylase [Bifidobacterium pseudolongum subsp. globosum]|uniref:oxalyl-CoA decarboxylase n=1 Tax=Bifidobacterium pseudolongum TaxID=1694 RepID=UPI001020E1A8|nr:oxalyl-CoA decarboxylase [Bifidobacterium pseudolongum]RYQ31277.1 Oxalyl-CoA decarboxylase [Bifidobacterium pseudolongum subsp. globosum]